METYEAIHTRRSIRRFKQAPVAHDTIRRLLAAAAAAPSAKNRQPWRFTVVEGDAKTEMLAQMDAGLQRERAGRAELPSSRGLVASAYHSWRIMRAAPCIVFITNPAIPPHSLPQGMEGHLIELADTQSVGAAIQNLCLAATAEGLGSLWICDIFFAYQELVAWLGEDKGQLVAAVALGWPDEAPPARPRQPMEELTEWRA